MGVLSTGGARKSAFSSLLVVVIVIVIVIVIVAVYTKKQTPAPPVNKLDKLTECIGDLAVDFLKRWMLLL